MKRFADLVDRLTFTDRDDRKLALLADYFRTVPDPDRGYALGVLIGALPMPRVSSATLRGLALERIDPVLFDLSHDFVGDLAESVALIWPNDPAKSTPLTLAAVVERLHAAGKAERPGQLAVWLNRLPGPQRWLLLKLATNGLRVNVSPHLARQALARLGGVDLGAIEAVWQALTPPYRDLFAWLDGNGSPPTAPAIAGYRPMMPVQQIDDDAVEKLDPALSHAVWTCDGLRCQLVLEGAVARLYGPHGDDLSARFPDLLDGLEGDAVLDGELLVVRNGLPGDTNDLQQRLKRKRPTAAVLADYPVTFRAFDLLARHGEDIRALELAKRLECLRDWRGATGFMGIELAPNVDFADWAALGETRTAAPPGTAGILLRRLDRPYDRSDAGTVWHLWRHPPQSVRALLLYVECEGNGRSGPPGSGTVALWQQDRLVPIGRVAFEFDDMDLDRLTAWVREHARERYGPVTQVAPDLVVDVAFDAVLPAPRRKAGLTLHNARLSRILWDAPATQAQSIDELTSIIAP